MRWIIATTVAMMFCSFLEQRKIAICSARLSKVQSRTGMTHFRQSTERVLL